MKVALVLVAVALTGCAVKSTMHVSTATGEIRNCSAHGWGWIGTPMALSIHRSCTDSMRSIGYVPLDDVEPAILLLDTDPPGAQFFSGPTAQELRPIGVSPIKLVHPQRSRSWASECFQAKKHGYKDSEIDCRGPLWGDRIVSIKLSQ